MHIHSTLLPAFLDVFYELLRGDPSHLVFSVIYFVIWGKYCIKCSMDKSVPNLLGAFEAPILCQKSLVDSPLVIFLAL